MLKRSKFNLFLAVFILLVIGFQAFALLTDWPTSPGGAELEDDSDLGTLIQYIFHWLVALGGLAAFIVLTIAGVQYLTSSGDPNKMGAARDRIQSAAIGLALLLGSVIILNIINPELVNLRKIDFDFAKGIGGNCSENHICVEDKFYENGQFKESKEFTCKGNDYCQHTFGEDYQCVSNRCSVDLSEIFTITNCDSVTVEIKAKKPGASFNKKVNINAGTYWIGDKYIVSPDYFEEGGSVEIRINPTSSAEKCLAQLVLYETTATAGGMYGRGCTGEKDFLVIQGGTSDYPINESSKLNYTPSFRSLGCIEFRKLK